MGFTNPGALGVREDHRDGYAGFLELVNEGVDIGGGLLGRRPVVVYYLKMLERICGSEGFREGRLTRTCMFVVISIVERL